MKQLHKSHNHLYFFTCDKAVYETYNTLRGIRCRFLFLVDYPDKDTLCSVDILLINSIQSNNLK